MSSLIRSGEEGFKAISAVPFARLEVAGDRQSNLSMLATLMGGCAQASMRQGGAVSVFSQRVRKGGNLFHEGARATAVYFIEMGSFKSLRTTEDGYEQVVAFSARRDVLGFDAVHLGRHVTSAVALEESRVYVISVDEMHLLGQKEPELGRALHVAISSQLHRYGALADLMSAVAAEVRLGRFLLQLSQRMIALGQSPSRLYLRMNRRDIASYLGLAHETVSRSFRSLVKAGYLEVNHREVEILDMEGLRECARGTRRASHESQGE